MPIGGATRAVGLIGGAGVARSRSPAIQNAALEALSLDARYLAFAVAEGAVERAVRGAQALGFVGLNVTMPHKEAAFRVAEVWDDPTAAIGACNTLWFTDGRIVARNTDAPAILDVLGDVAGADAVVLGAGGSARAAVYALRSARAERVRVLARSRDRAEWAELLGAEIGGFEPLALAAADVIVSCVPPGVELSLEHAAPRARFLDLVYQEESALLRQARRRKLQAQDGLEMLVRQAAHAFRVWFGVAPPLDVMRAAAKRA